MSTSRLRLVRLAPDPLGLYVRAGRIDQKDLQSFITSGAAAFTGVVFEAKRVARQKELLSLVLERGLDAVLDPQTQAMATIGGYARSMDGLPWSKKRPHALSDLATAFQQRQLAEDIAKFAIEYGFTQVIAPTHLISGPDDPWLAIDIALANALRVVLERQGAGHVQIHYSLALSYETFRTLPKRLAVLEQLRHARVDGLWLNVSGCGSDSSPTAISRYADAASDFHALGIPIIADHAGGLMGLSLLAFGAVGGLAHGVTLGERFDTSGWHKVPEGKTFGAKARVYLPALDLMLPRVDAERFFEAGGGALSLPTDPTGRGIGADPGVDSPHRFSGGTPAPGKGTHVVQPLRLLGRLLRQVVGQRQLGRDQRGVARWGPMPRSDATRPSRVTRSRAWPGAAGADKPLSMTHHLPIHRHRGMP